MPVQPRTTSYGTPGATGPLSCFRRGSPVASESHRATGNSGKALPGAGLAGPGSRDGGSPSRVGPGPGPSPGGLAGGWDSPSYLAAVDPGTEEPSRGSTTAGRFAAGMAMKGAQPSLSPALSLASRGRTERTPGVVSEGGGPKHPVPSARHGERRTPRHLRSPERACPGAELRRRGSESDGAPSARPRTPRNCFLREEKEINHQRAFIFIIIIIIIAIIVSLHINK